MIADLMPMTGCRNGRSINWPIGIVNVLYRPRSMTEKATFPEWTLRLRTPEDLGQCSLGQWLAKIVTHISLFFIPTVMLTPTATLD